MEARLIKHGHSYALMHETKLVAFAHPEEFASPYTIGALSIENCKEIEFGFDLASIIDEEFSKLDQDARIIYRRQIQEGMRSIFFKAFEVIGEREFTKGDMQKIYQLGRLERHESDKNVTLVDNSKTLISSLQNPGWNVVVQWEEDEPTRYRNRTVIRRLDNGEEIEWTCFWDSGWWTHDGVKCPNVIDWSKMPLVDGDGKLILKPKTK